MLIKYTMSENQLRNSFEFETRMIPTKELPFVPPKELIYLRKNFSIRPLVESINLEDFLNESGEGYSLYSLSPVTIEFTPIAPNTQAFYCFALEAIPLFPQYNFWKRTEFNNGDIGGQWDSPYRNLWPDPVIKQFRGRDYRLYIASYATNITTPVELWVK
jgi:hypothetical protein